MKVEVLDTTLRDGAQHRQVSYSSVDKLDVIAALDRLGVHYTEYGAPGFDPAAEKLSRLGRKPPRARRMSYPYAYARR